MPVISEYMHTDFPLLQTVNLYLSFKIKKIKMETKAHFPVRKLKIIKSFCVRLVIYYKRDYKENNTLFPYISYIIFNPHFIFAHAYI